MCNVFKGITLQVHHCVLLFLCYHGSLLSFMVYMAKNKTSGSFLDEAETLLWSCQAHTRECTLTTLAGAHRFLTTDGRRRVPAATGCLTSRSGEPIFSTSHFTSRYLCHRRSSGATVFTQGTRVVFARYLLDCKAALLSLTSCFAWSELVFSKSTLCDVTKGKVSSPQLVAAADVGRWFQKLLYCCFLNIQTVKLVSDFSRKLTSEATSRLLLSSG